MRGYGHVTLLWSLTWNSSKWDGKIWTERWHDMTELKKIPGFCSVTVWRASWTRTNVHYEASVKCGWTRVRGCQRRSPGRRQAWLQTGRGNEEFRMVLRVMIAEVHKGWDPELSSGEDVSEILSDNEGRYWLHGWTYGLEKEARLQLGVTHTEEKGLSQCRKRAYGGKEGEAQARGS